MADYSDFLGVWRAAKGFPYSIHTITWESAGPEVRGRWMIEAAAAPADRDGQEAPQRFEMLIAEPRLEDGVLLFQLNGGPFLTEFRLDGHDDAVVGAALDRLPAEFAAAEYRHSIEGHRVRVRRQSALS